MKAAPPVAPRELIAFGLVRHTRVRPVRHAFSYPGLFVMLPLRSLRSQHASALPRNRFGLLSFFDADHGDGSPDCLDWFERLLASEGVCDADGEVWLLTLPRVLGRVFKPVSFWFAHRQDGTLAAIVAEVNNTFGERHCYVLPDTRDASAPPGAALAWGRELQADKVMHVSPFCQPSGRYRFRFMRTDAASPHGERVVVRVDHDDAQGELLRTSLSGALQPLSPATVWLALAHGTWGGLGVLARIHWQALQLWLKRVPFFSKPPAPTSFVSR